MNDYVIEYYEQSDPCRVFIWETKATTEIEAHGRFYYDPVSRGCSVQNITEGKWDKENFKIIL